MLPIRVSALLALAALASGCSHTFTSSQTAAVSTSAPFAGTWTRHWIDVDHNSGRRVTFAFTQDGTGTMTLVLEGVGGSTQAHPFTWHKDGPAVNIVYPDQADRDSWSVSDDGKNLTLTDSSGSPDVYQKT